MRSAQVRTALKQPQNSYVPLLKATQTFRIHSPTMVPGLLQTEGYAAGLLSSIMRFRDIPDDVADTGRPDHGNDHEATTRDITLGRLPRPRLPTPTTAPTTAGERPTEPPDVHSQKEVSGSRRRVGARGRRTS